MTSTEARDSFFLPDLCTVGAVLILVLLAQLLALVLTLAVAIDSGFSWEFLALGSLFTQWVTLVSAALLCALRSQLAGLTVPRAAATSYLLILLVAFGCSVAGQYLGFIGNSGTVGWRTTLIHLLIAAIVAGIALRYFYLQQQLRQQQEAELRARIQALQARIRPHFLFNSMNAIASLIASDPLRAEQAVEEVEVGDVESVVALDCLGAEIEDELVVVAGEDRPVGKDTAREAAPGFRYQPPAGKVEDDPCHCGRSWSCVAALWL